MTQCKDIPDEPILRFLAQRPGVWHNWYFGNPLDVRQAMPSGLPDNLIIAKMRTLIRRGLVKGCGCGCRGDFEITPKGLYWLQTYQQLFASSDSAIVPVASTQIATVQSPGGDDGTVAASLQENGPAVAPAASDGMFA